MVQRTATRGPRSRVWRTAGHPSRLVAARWPV